MKELLYLLRAMQLYSHNCHNLVKGTSFLSDHNLFGDIYGELEAEYDGVAERIVGIYGEESLQIQEMMMQISSKLQDAPSVGVPDNRVFVEHQLKMENKLTDLVNKIVQVGVSNGVEQLITEISNKSEMRKYKLKQRLK